MESQVLKMPSYFDLLHRSGFISYVIVIMLFLSLVLSLISIVRNRTGSSFITTLLPSLGAISFFLGVLGYSSSIVTTHNMVSMTNDSLRPGDYSELAITSHIPLLLGALTASLYFVFYVILLCINAVKNKDKKKTAPDSF